MRGGLKDLKLVRPEMGSRRGRGGELLFRWLIIGILFLGVMPSNRGVAGDHPDELYRQRYFEEAEEAYADLDMEHPEDIRYRYNRGCAAYESLEFGTARAVFTSVLRKTEEHAMRFRTAYNLGNTAFKQDDFSSAAAYYKQAIFYDPGNLDAKHNLELTLRTLQKLDERKNPEKKTRPEKGADTRGGQGAGGSGEEDNPQPEEVADEDLTGELERVEGGEEELSEDSAEKPTSIMNKKKAEDLLDQIREDRARFMHFQIPKDKGRGVKSGKDW
jgi:Ca-activated chloride channel family protein